MYPALILGFNIHGLALARALAKRGIEVYAIAQSAELPSNRTRFAKVHIRDGVNSEQLIEILLKFADEHFQGRKPVIFPTSDNMVRALGEHWPSIEAHYFLSWAGRRSLVLELLRKNNLPDICDKQGVDHPPSVDVTGIGDCDRVFDHLTAPLLIKPARPLSGFKTLKLTTQAELAEAIRRYGDDLPLVAQRWIEGDDSSLYFCTFFLDNGRELCAFTGRKLRAVPPGLGQGTVVTCEDNPKLLELSRNFLQGMNFTGPVAIEFKKDSEGRYWLIEPNVGRTEFCVDLLIQCGINLPWIEYCHATGLRGDSGLRQEMRMVTWFDTDKDPLCYLRYRFSRAWRSAERKDPVFPYYGHSDPRPLFMSLFFQARRALQAVRRCVLRRSKAVGKD